MAVQSSSHWLSLLFRNNSRALMPKKLFELGSEPTVGMPGLGSPRAASLRLPKGPTLWLGGFSGVDSSLLLLLPPPPPPAPRPPLLPRTLPSLGVLASPLCPDASSLRPSTESEQPSLQQSSLQEIREEKRSCDSDIHAGRCGIARFYPLPSNLNSSDPLCYVTVKPSKRWHRGPLVTRKDSEICTVSGRPCDTSLEWGWGNPGH